MNKTIATLAVLLGIPGLLTVSLAATKPSQDYFSSWLGKKICIEISQESNPLGLACKSIFLVHGETAKRIVDLNTKVDSFVVLDHYTTELPGLEIKAVGIANSYIIYQFQ